VASGIKLKLSGIFNVENLEKGQILKLTTPTIFFSGTVP
jgi:hypothetical protein